MYSTCIKSQPNFEVIVNVNRLYYHYHLITGITVPRFFNCMCITIITSTTLYSKCNLHYYLPISDCYFPQHCIPKLSWHSIITFVHDNAYNAL